MQPLSSQIYGFYTALVYLTPIFGGLLADRVLGQRRTVVIGAVLMAIGHFMMAVEQLFLFALLALILGNGAFKPNISTQVGGLYRGRPAPRPGLFDLLCRHQRRRVSGAACLRHARRGGGLALRLRRRRRRHADRVVDLSLCDAAVAAGRIAEGSAAHSERRPLDRNEWRGIAAILVLFIPTALFWATYEQGGNTIVLWADANTDRTIGLLGHSAEIPTTWFLAVNPLLIFAFTPFVVALWTRQAARGTEPSTVTKMALGCLGVALSYLIMAAAGWQAGAGKASWLWLAGYFVVVTIGELYLSPVGLSLVTKIAPLRIMSMMMGVWLATSFVGGFLAGYIGSFWSRMEKPEFFLLVAAIAALAGLIIFACRWPLKGALDEYQGLVTKEERQP